MLTHFIGNLRIVQRVVQTTVEAVHLRLRQEVPFIVDVKTGKPAAAQQCVDIHILMMGFQIVDVIAQYTAVVKWCPMVEVGLFRRRPGSCQAHLLPETKC
jgi:hypothetical protein